MQQSEKPTVDTSSSSQRSDIEWKREREEFVEREQKYQDQLKELQAELDDLQDIDSECKRLGEEKAGLVKKCKDIFEEHQTTLQG
jgi:adenylate cyclase class IV